MPVSVPAALPPRPEGRLSMRKLDAFASAVNVELAKLGARYYVEVGHHSGYYVMYELDVHQYRWRLGARDEQSNSGVSRSNPGLSARECLERIIRHFEGVARG